MDDYHYKHKDYLMTPAEHDFFKNLIDIVGEKYYIFPQIHLSALISPDEKWSYGWLRWHKASFYSNEYSVDYVLCDKQDIKPLLVIELDDNSHLREKRLNRDSIVKKMLDEAQLRIIRFTVSEINDFESVKNQLKERLKPN